MDLVDRELLPALENYPPTELNLDNLAETRRVGEQMARELNAQLPDVEEIVVEDRQVSGPDGDPDVRVRIYRPDAAPDPLPGFFWIHGGGYVLGSIHGDDYGCKLRARNVGCVIVSVDYRRAPEHPYPAPLEDCYAALKWMAANAEDLGIDAGRIAIGGASAGGGLAAGLALLVRDRKEIEVAFQMLIYPMINDRNILPAGKERLDTLIWNRAKNLFGWTCYLGTEPGGDDIPYTAAAFRARDLSGLPPAIIVVGDLDLFMDEDIEYARRLIQAGIPTELHVFPGAYHGFNGFAPGATVSRRCNATCNEALKRALTG